MDILINFKKSKKNEEAIGLYSKGYWIISYTIGNLTSKSVFIYTIHDCIYSHRFSTKSS